MLQPVLQSAVVTVLRAVSVVAAAAAAHYLAPPAASRDVASLSRL